MAAKKTLAYSIKGWNKTFETSDSKRYKNLPWISVPTKQDGKGRRRLVRLPNGAALFGAWVAMTQVAAKCPTRGVLADEEGPLDANDLEMITDIPAELFDELFHVLTSVDQKIGWLEQIDWFPPGCDPGDAQRANNDCRATKHNETEPDRTEHDKTETEPESADATASDSGSPEARARLSGSDSPPATGSGSGEGLRIRAEAEFFSLIESASRGERVNGNLPDKQLKADMTTARNWWHDHIWPPGQHDLGPERFDRFRSALRQARQGGARNPLAYISHRIDREIKYGKPSPLGAMTAGIGGVSE